MSETVHVQLSVKIGEKAATNEVISKLVSALEDESDLCQMECM